MSSTKPIFAWQETKAGLVIIVLIDSLSTYGFASLAIDRGSLLDYFIAAVFLMLAIIQAIKLFKKATGNITR